MRTQKRQLLKTIIFLMLFISILFTFFIKNSITSYAAVEGSYTLSGETAGTMDNKSTCNYWTNSSNNLKFNKYIDEIQFKLSSDGSITLSTNGYWKTLWNNTYETGSDYYPEEGYAGATLEDSNDNNDIWSDYKECHNLTLNLTERHQNVFVKINNQTKGGFLKSYNSVTINGFGNLTQDTVSVRFYIVWAYHSGHSEQYDEHYYYYYCTYWDFSIRIKDETKPTLKTNGTTIADNTIFKDPITVTCADDVKISKWYFTRGTNNYTTISPTTLSGSSYRFSEDGYYTVTATDTSNNSTTAKFIIDRTAPTISGVEKDAYYNSSKTLTFSDATSGIKTVTVNSKNVELTGNKYTISPDTYSGTINITVYDNANNISSISFKMDKIAPAISGVSNGAIVKEAIISFSDNLLLDNCKYSYSINDYDEDPRMHISSTGSTKFTDEGYYYIKAVDKAQNTTILKFIIDRTTPTISGVNSGAYYNSSKTLTFSDNQGINREKFYINGQKVTLNNNTYTISPDTYSGPVTIRIEDIAGNSSSMTFYFDTAAPALTVNKSNTNGIYYTNNTITIDANEYVDFEINQNKYSNRNTLTLNAASFENKQYTLTATDKAGNKSTIKIHFDKSTPEIDFSTAIVDSKGIFYTNGNQRVFVSSSSSPISSIQYTLNGQTIPVSSNSTSFNLTEAGNYEITVTTLAGNSNTKTLIIDKTAPDLDIKSDGILLTDKSYTNNTCTITFSDKVLLSTNPAFYSINDGELKPFTNNSQFSEDGVYMFIIYDYSGNSTSKKITIEKTPPTISGVSLGAYYNSSKTLSFYDSDSGIKTVTINGESVSLNNDTFVISPATYYGRINIHVEDQAGNTADYYFHMDNKFATCNIENGKYYSSDIRLSIQDYMLSSSSFLQKNQEDPIYLSTASQQFINTTGDGVYILHLIDNANNEVEYKFYIDTIPPTATISGYTSNEENLYKANASSSIVVNFDATEAVVHFNNVIYTTGKFTIDASSLDDGEYEILVEDKAGNNTTYVLDIKSSVPHAIITGYYSFNNNIYYANGESNIEIDWTDTSAKVIVNGNEEYRNKFTLICSTLPEGIYNLVIIDTYNNSTSYQIVVDKQKDSNNYNFLTSQYYSWINHYWNTYEYTYSNFNYYPGKNHSFSSYEAAQEYARVRETSIYEKIKYEGQNIFASNQYGNVSEFYDYEELSSVQIGDEVYIYKSLTSSKIVVYFSYANFKKALDHYVDSSITEYYRHFSNNSTIAEAHDTSLYYETFYIPAEEFTLSKAESTTIIYTSENGNNYTAQTNKAVLTSGINYVKEIDIAGNITEYVVILNTTPISFSVLNNTNYTRELKNTQKLYASSPITLLLDGKFVEHNIIKLSYTDLDKNTTISYITDDGLNLTAEGTYVIDTYDIFGNKSLSYTVYILYSEQYLPSICHEINKLDGIVIDLTFNISYYKLVSNQITNIIVKFTDTEGSSRYLSTDGNGTPITTNITSLTFFESGEYEISLTDIFGNDTSDFETLQKGTPFGQLFAGDTAVPSGTITNQNIYFQFNPEYEYSCNLNGAVYINGTGISKEGIYEFTLSNLDTTATYIIQIDKTAPEGNLVVDGNLFPTGKTTSSHNVLFTFDEEDATATLNGLKIRNNTLLSEEGQNTIYLQDKAGNITEYNITLDYTAPTVKIYSGSYEVENGAIVNQKIRFVWSENNCTAYLNGVLYTSGRNYSTPGTYTLIIQDRWGNAAEYYVILDLSTPEFVVKDINDNLLLNNAKINTGFLVGWQDDTYSVYLNNAPYTKNTIITTSGTNIIQVINQAGTIETFAVNISYTAPQASIYTYDNQILSSGSMTNQRFYISWNDTRDNRFSCVVNDKNYANGNIIREDGEYQILLTDEYGNSTTYEITRDTVAPTGTLVGVENGGITNQDVSFYSHEVNVKMFLDGLRYLDNSLILEEGKHEIIIEDQVGNSQTYTFEIDKTAPEFKFELEPNENGYINHRTSISWSENNCTAYLNERTYMAGARIYDGSYQFILIDKAGNKSECSFIVDSTTPIINISGIDKVGNSNSTVTVEWIGNYTVLANDVIIETGTQFSEDGIYVIIAYSLSGNSCTSTFEISTKKPTGSLIGVENGGSTRNEVSFIYDSSFTATINGKSYSSSEMVSKEGNYTIILTDKFTNQSIYTFEIDKTAPTAILNGCVAGKSTRTDVIIVFDDDDATATLNGEIYISETLITEEGMYELILVDYVGNTRTYTFEIDKTAPDCVFQNVEPDGQTNQTVYISWSELNCIAYLNDKSYTAGTPIRDEGNYKFEIRDSLGNTNTYTFKIDKTAPEFNILTENDKAVVPNTIINLPFYVTWEESKVTCTCDGETYVYGQIINDDGEHVFVISDFLGNQYQFIMTIDYSLPTAILNGVENGGSTNGNVIVSFNIEYYAILNGRPYTSGSRISEEGQYTLIIYSSIGSSNTYTFEIDKTAPEFLQIIGLNENNYSNTGVQVFFDEEDATATLNGNNYYSGVSLSEEGTYILVLKDSVGNESTLSFEIITSLPEGTLIGVENYGYTNKPVSFIFDNNLTATLNDYKYSSDTPIKIDGTHTILLKDKAGNTNTYTFEISTKKPTATFDGLNNYNLSNTEVTIHTEALICRLNNRPYKKESGSISEEGIYTLYLQDKYGNTNTYTFEIDKTAPMIEVVGVDETGYTNKNVYITWKEDDCAAYLNNSIYLSGTPVRSDGKFEFVLTDKAGNSCTYAWERSSVLPEGKFNVDFKNPNFTNQDVIFTFEDATATLNGEAYSSGSMIIDEGTYVIQLLNKYGNINNYTFEIDKTAPVFELKGVDPNGYTNKKVILSTTESNIDVYVNDELWTKDYITLSQLESYNKHYTVKVVDKAGNFTELSFDYFYEDLKDKLQVEKNGDETAATINYPENYTCTLNGEIISSGQLIDEAGSYNILLTDKYGNEYSLKLTLREIKTPNYIFRNVATILTVLFLSGIVLFVFVKKLKGPKSNPYKKTK